MDRTNDSSPEDIIREREAVKKAKKLADAEALSADKSKRQQVFIAKLSEAMTIVDDETKQALDRLRHRGWPGGVLTAVVTEYAVVTERTWWFKKHKYTEQHTEELAVWSLFLPNEGGTLSLASNGKVYKYGPSRHINDDNRQLKGHHDISPSQTDVLGHYWPIVSEYLPTTSELRLKERANALVAALRKIGVDQPKKSFPSLGR